MLSEGFWAINFVEIGEDDKKFVKQFFLPILTDEVYIRFGKTQERSNLETINEGFLKVDWSILVYDDDFFTSISKSRRPLI